MISDSSADAEVLTRAIIFVTVALSACERAPLICQESVTADFASERRTHWGTLPVTAFCLANLAVVDQAAEVIIGSGHAGIAQLAFAWLKGELEAVDAVYSPDVDGLNALCRDLPNLRGIGTEVSPRLSAGRYVGGLIGGALAFATGLSRTTTSNSYVLVGDGEMETPTTAASWLPASSFASVGLVPIVNLNQYKMGSRSAISMLSDSDIARYFGAQGWDARLIDCLPRDPTSHDHFQREVGERSRERRVLVLRSRKGQDGYWPLLDVVAEKTDTLHKAPLGLLSINDRATAAEAWLASYRPWELFTTNYEARGVLAKTLKRLDGQAHRVGVSVGLPLALPKQTPQSFAEAVTEAVQYVRRVAEVWVLSPDELASNGLAYLGSLPDVIEILAEEVLGFIQAGLAAGGTASLLVSYEAFSTLLIPGVNALLKTLTQIGVDDRMSTNILLTSYGWENSFTHGDPTFASMLVCNPQSRVKITFPHTTTGLCTALVTGLQSRGRINVAVAGKRQLRPGYSLATGSGYVTYGESGRQVVVAMGDLASNVALDAQAASRSLLSVFVVEDPGAVQSKALWEAVWPSGREDRRPVLFLTITHPWAVIAILPSGVRPFVQVRGWVEEARPLDPDDRLERAGLTPEAVLSFFLGGQGAADF